MDTHPIDCIGGVVTTGPSPRGAGVMRPDKRPPIPGLTVYFDKDAKDLFDSYQAMVNIRGANFRDQQDADAAAEEGVIPVMPWPSMGSLPGSAV